MADEEYRHLFDVPCDHEGCLAKAAAMIDERPLCGKHAAEIIASRQSPPAQAELAGRPR
ncbi:MAG: hypothetical protein JO247_01180 [Chloroflexi bacterium]|nr:hypothetical protein [Chloroflexota bacterium]